MEIESKVDNSTFQMVLKGSMEVMSDADLLRMELDRAKNFAKIVIDLSQVSFMDSVFIDTLISFRNRFASENGKVSMVHPSPFVQDFLQMTGLDWEFAFDSNRPAEAELEQVP